MTALPGQGGITAAWKMEVAAVDGMAASLGRMLGVEDKRKLIRAAINGMPPYAIPNVTIEAVAPGPALPHRLHARLAASASSPSSPKASSTSWRMPQGMEPLAFRMSMLGRQRPPRALPSGRGAARGMGRRRTGQHHGDRRAAPRSDRTSGSSRTPASASDQRVKVAPARRGGGLRPRRQHRPRRTADRSAVSSGRWRRPPSPRPNGSPECLERGRFGALGLPRLGDHPQIIVEIIPSSDPPGGISGLGTTVLAPAVANAIYAGIRQADALAAVRPYGGRMIAQPIIRSCPSRRSACC